MMCEVSPSFFGSSTVPSKRMRTPPGSSTDITDYLDMYAAAFAHQLKANPNWPCGRSIDGRAINGGGK
jgi:hypothetical protein